MAKKFYYDSVDLLNATITAGNRVVNSETGGISFSVSASEITNEHYITDQSIASAVTDYDDESTTRVDLREAKAVSHILIHNNVGDENNFHVYQSSNATSSLSSFGNTLTTTTKGWNLITGSSTHTKRYFFLSSVDGDYSGLTEVIMGVPLEFENEPDVGTTETEIFGTTINTSIGGVEYANKKHEPKSTWQLKFANISQTFKNNLVSFEQSVTNFKKFVYYDDSNYHYVRLDSPIRFSEIAHQRFSASFKLREQLS